MGLYFLIILSSEEFCLFQIAVALLDPFVYCFIKLRSCYSLAVQTFLISIFYYLKMKIKNYLQFLDCSIFMSCFTETIILIFHLFFYLKKAFYFYFLVV